MNEFVKGWDFRMIAVQPKSPLAGNTATGALKIIALCFMFMDHAGKMLFPNVPELRVLGRIAFPLYAWCLVVGFHYTRNVWKYGLRLLLVGAVSQPLYMQALRHTWTEPNIFLTLLMGLLALICVSEKAWEQNSLTLRIAGRALAAVGLAAVLVLTVLLRCDYGWKGVLLIVLLYAVRNSRAGLAAVMVAFCLYWGTGSSTIVRLFGLPIQQLSGAANTLLSPWLRIQAMAILSAPFILFPWKHDLRIPHWLGYALYPAHLLLLWGLEAIM